MCHVFFRFGEFLLAASVTDGYVRLYRAALFSIFGVIYAFMPCIYFAFVRLSAMCPVVYVHEVRVLCGRSVTYPSMTRSTVFL